MVPIAAKDEQELGDRKNKCTIHLVYNGIDVDIILICPISKSAQERGNTFKELLEHDLIIFISNDTKKYIN